MYIASSITNINAEAGINSGHRKPAIIHTNTNTKLRKKTRRSSFDRSIRPIHLSHLTMEAMELKNELKNADCTNHCSHVFHQISAAWLRQAL